MDTMRVLSTGDELKEHKMVLQCQTCRTIVGDSKELVCVFTVDADQSDDDDDNDNEEVQYISIACTCVRLCLCVFSVFPTSLSYERQTECSSVIKLWEVLLKITTAMQVHQM